MSIEFSKKKLAVIVLVLLAAFQYLGNSVEGKVADKADRTAQVLEQVEGL